MKLRKVIGIILFTTVCCSITSLRAESIFFEGFEEYTTSDPTDWIRNNTTRILVVTNGEFAVSTTQKVASGLRSVFFRDGTGRTLTQKDTAKVNVNPGSTVVLSFKMSQNSTAYETDYAKFLLKFGTNDYVEAIYDPGKIDGCGTASSPIDFNGTRIDLPVAYGYDTNFISYFIKFTMPADSDSFLMKFNTNSGSDNEDYWLDDINVEKTVTGTFFIVK